MARLSKKYLAPDSVDGTKLRFSNNEAFRLRNNTDNADVEAFKLDTSDILQFLVHPRITTSASALDDVITLKDLNQQLEGLKPKEACKVATTAPLTSLAGLAPIDSRPVIPGDRILVKNGTTANPGDSSVDNGIYVAAPGAWSRATDMDATSPINEVNGAYTAVEDGDVNGGQFFVQSNTVTSLGADPLKFVMFRSVTELTGGDGIDITSDVVSVDHDGEGFTFVSGQLALELDGASLSKSPTGLQVAAGGITEDKLGSDVDAESLQIAAGYTPSAGTVNVGDTVQEALEKLDGNINTKQDELTAGDGIDLSGATVSVDLSADPYLEFSAGDLQAKTSADYANAAAGELMDASDIKTKVDAVEALANAKQDPISGQEAIDVTSDVVSLTLAASDSYLDQAAGLKAVVAADYASAGAGELMDAQDIKDAIAGAGGTPNREILTLSGSDITNGYVDLAQTPDASSIEVTPVDGPLQEFGVDYTVSTNRVTFAGDLASFAEAGDKLIISYEY